MTASARCRCCSGRRPRCRASSAGPIRSRPPSTKSSPQSPSAAAGRLPRWFVKALRSASWSPPRRAASAKTVPEAMREYERLAPARHRGRRPRPSTRARSRASTARPSRPGARRVLERDPERLALRDDLVAIQDRDAAGRLRLTRVPHATTICGSPGVTGLKTTAPSGGPGRAPCREVGPLAHRSPPHRSGSPERRRRRADRCRRNRPRASRPAPTAWRPLPAGSRPGPGNSRMPSPTARSGPQPKHVGNGWRSSHGDARAAASASASVRPGGEVGRPRAALATSVSPPTATPRRLSAYRERALDRRRRAQR